MTRKASAIELHDAQREKLVKLAHSNTKEVRLTTQTKPVSATSWSTRTLAEVAGVSDTTIEQDKSLHLICDNYATHTRNTSRCIN
ncbi:MAG: hypothetical protein ABI728_00420 [Betaproteobacteria bacterium]